MQERTLISAKEFCSHHQIELTFIHSLHDYGLISGTAEEEDYLLPQEQLQTVEKLVRLRYDLHINMEGLDAISHLLQRMEVMQRELTVLRNKMRMYEGG